MSTFANIDPTTLDDVTGGTVPAQHGPSASTSALTTQISGLQDSIKSLATQPQKSAFSDPTTAMMFCMALQRQNTVVAAPSVVYVGGGRRHWW